MSPLKEFVPVGIEEILLYSWAYGGETTFENYFDDLIITGDPDYVNTNLTKQTC